MSVVLKDVPRLARMREADIGEVAAIENAVYSHPWTRGNFADSLRSDYECHTWRLGGELIGYFVLLIGPQEAHLLNLAVAAGHQRRGHGSAILREVSRIARERGALQLFLEVRPSNTAACALYEKFGFRRIGLRGAYYPALGGREDALVMASDL
ncbi:MAG: ribosomal protein S18-alanine N-acetyltransferase [Betaproteobacteria bacterium]|nr:ribosomal protein S18-alanine N-acetyltransferase [Betaproteobacteria bacterium]